MHTARIRSNRCLWSFDVFFFFWKKCNLYQNSNAIFSNCIIQYDLLKFNVQLIEYVHNIVVHLHPIRTEYHIVL